MLVRCLSVVCLVLCFSFSGHAGKETDTCWSFKELGLYVKAVTRTFNHPSVPDLSYEDTRYIVFRRMTLPGSQHVSHQALQYMDTILEHAFQKGRTLITRDAKKHANDHIQHSWTQKNHRKNKTLKKLQRIINTMPVGGHDEILAMDNHTRLQAAMPLMRLLGTPLSFDILMMAQDVSFESEEDPETWEQERCRDFKKLLHRAINPYDHDRRMAPGICHPEYSRMFFHEDKLLYHQAKMMMLYAPCRIFRLPKDMCAQDIHDRLQAFYQHDHGQKLLSQHLLQEDTEDWGEMWYRFPSPISQEQRESLELAIMRDE